MIADRFAITGARWGLAGAEAVLRLRTVISNGDFEEYWEYHAQREHLRVHAIRYHGSLALAGVRCFLSDLRRRDYAAVVKLC